MVEATELIQQKCLAHGGLQPFEQLRDALQGLQGLVANLRRRMARLGQQRQGFEIRTLQRIPPPVIDQQATCDTRQQGTRRTIVDRLVTHQQTQKGVLNQIRRLLRTADRTPQPAMQPALMRAVQHLKGNDRIGFGRGHKAAHTSRLKTPWRSMATAANINSESFLLQIFQLAKHQPGESGRPTSLFSASDRH